MNTEDIERDEADGAGNDGLEARLRAALAPPPLSARLRERVIRGFAAQPAAFSARRNWHRPLVAALAACLLLAAIPRPDAAQYSSDALLSRSEAAQIARALALLTWSPPLEPAIERAARSVERIRATLAGENPESGLSGDDWDLPAPAATQPRQNSHASDAPSTHA